MRSVVVAAAAIVVVVMTPAPVLAHLVHGHRTIAVCIEVLDDPGERLCELFGRDRRVAVVVVALEAIDHVLTADGESPASRTSDGRTSPRNT